MGGPGQPSTSSYSRLQEDLQLLVWHGQQRPEAINPPMASGCQPICATHSLERKNCSGLP